jgi:hypothetical protein
MSLSNAVLEKLKSTTTAMLRSLEALKQAYKDTGTGAA